MGRKRIDVDINEVERLAGLGLTQEEIALSLGIARMTLESRKRENELFVEAIKRGKARANQQVANVLYEKATGGDMTAVIWWEKTRAGRTDRQVMEHTGPDGGPIEITAVPYAEDELAEWRQRQRRHLTVTAEALSG